MSKKAAATETYEEWSALIERSYEAAQAAIQLYGGSLFFESPEGLPAEFNTVVRLTWHRKDLHPTDVLVALTQQQEESFMKTVEARSVPVLSNRPTLSVEDVVSILKEMGLQFGEG